MAKNELLWDGIRAEYNRRRLHTDMGDARDMIVLALRGIADSIEKREVTAYGREMEPDVIIVQ